MKNTKLKKAITTSLLGLFLYSSTMPSVSLVTVSANETTRLTHLPPIKESDYIKPNQITTRSIWSKIAKTAIRKAIKNKRRLIEFVEKVAGKTVARNADKFFTPITNALNPLLAWSEIPGQAVYDAVFRAVVNSGGSRATAASIANAIREVLEWTLF